MGLVACSWPGEIRATIRFNEAQHRFTVDMLTNWRLIKRDPRVQVVIDMDGNGTPSGKTQIYKLIITRHPVQFTGFKLFYHLDHPMMPIADVLALQPIPLYIQYQ